MNKIFEILEDASRNNQGKYSHCRIGTIIGLSAMIFVFVYIGITKPEVFAEHAIGFGAVIALLTGGRKIAETYSDKIKGDKPEDKSPPTKTN